MIKLLKAIWVIIEEYFATKEEVASPVVEEPIVAPTMTEELPKYYWDNPTNARHSVRVICDEEGLSWEEKNIVTAVIAAESGFYNTAKNENKNSKGVVTSTDWGICQINDHYHIGEKLTFPSVEYVINNPEMVVRWMIKMYKAGRITMWCAYQNGSYKRFMVS